MINSAAISTFISLLRDIASPAYCLYCWKLLQERVPLCVDCTEKIRAVVSHQLALSPSSARSITVHALGAYEGPLPVLIRAKQYRSLVSAHSLGILMSAEFSRHLNPEHDILVPIPLHWRRYAWRGFNQAELMANVIAKKTSVPMVNLLRRVSATAYQASCSAEERHENVAQAFAISPRIPLTAYEHKRIVLVDDLLTTGATIRSAARVLNKVTKSDIICFVAARVD